MKLMRRRPLAYDISRLASRLFNRTPNGIDRVDFALASHFIDLERDDRSGLMMTTIGPRVFLPRAARDMLELVRRNWGEARDPDEDAEFSALLAAVLGPPAHWSRWRKARAGRGAGLAAWLGQHGLRTGFKPRDFLSERGVYLNVSQFPLEAERYFRWIDPRDEIDKVFFIHDLLPFQMPEYFRPREHALHERRMKTLAKIARAAIVSSQVVKSALEERVAGLGRTGMPILVAPLPVDPVFSEPVGAEFALGAPVLRHVRNDRAKEKPSADLAHLARTGR